MIENIKTSILPMALWTENPPVHNITSILHLDKSNTIVTGSECGHIFVWSTKTCDNQLVPLHYIIGHRSKIITLVLAGSRKHTDNDYFVSFSNDRELGLWDAESGRSIEFVSNATFDVQSVVSFESDNVKQRLLFCCLKSPEIVIINSMLLSELCTLKCTNCLNLYSSVTSFNISTKDDMVLASTVSGLTSMWVLNFADVNNKPTFNPKLNSEKALKIELSDPIKITHNPHQTKIVLIISACKFMIYHAKDWSVLCYQDCRRGDYFINGEFITTNSFLMHCQSGKSFYYKLPPRSDVGHPLFGQVGSDLSDNLPHLICQFKEPKDSILSCSKVTTKITDLGFIIWKGNSDGSIYKWDFKANVTEMEAQVFSVSSSWKALKKSPTSLTNMFTDPSKSGPVTSLLYIADLCLFVLGMYDGSIFITNFENSLGNVFRKTPPNPSHFIKLTGHCGPVLCLIHPCSSLKFPTRLLACSNTKSKSCVQLFKLAHIIWSGGEDFTIRIWNMKSKQCVNVFHCHSAPVVLFRLNHLQYNAINIIGISNPFATAASISVTDDDGNSEDVKQMINTCVNAFMVVISEDDGISIVSMMKPKILLYSVEHDSPVKNLGWALDSRCVLLETTRNTVYVWDLSSRSMDRYETEEIAQSLMMNCAVITKIRSQSIWKVHNSSDMIGRHSLTNLTSYNSCRPVTASNKFIKFQFIKTGVTSRYVPVVIFDITTLLNSIDIMSNTATKFYSLLSEIDNSIIQGFRSSDLISIFDTLMKDVTAVNKDMDLKILMIKIIFSRAHFQHTESPIDSKLYKFLDLKTDKVSCSFGIVNSKTGCITFSLKDLFKEEPSESSLKVENVLLQLAICKRLTESSNRNHLNDSEDGGIVFESSEQFVYPRSRSTSTISNNFSEYNNSSQLSKLLLAYQSSIIDKHVPMLLKKSGEKKRFSDCPKNLSFCSMEKLFHTLVLGILDLSDWISSSSYQIVIKVIEELSDKEIHNYFITIRTILLPDLDHYTTEGGRNFSTKCQAYLQRFSEQSFLASDWIWWYLSPGIKVDLDKRRLTKIQIMALVYLAIIGTYLPSDDDLPSPYHMKSFSKMFGFDNYFLARITCDFMCNLLSVYVPGTRRSKNRLVSLAMHCLSHGFTAWEPYLSSSTLIYRLFEYTEQSFDELECEEEESILRSLAKEALKTIALSRPSVFVMACYREMLRLISGQHNYSSIGNPVPGTIKHNSLQRMKSSPAFMNSYDAYDSSKMENQSAILNGTILFPILEELCEFKREVVEELLPEIIEIYINCGNKFGPKEIHLQHLLYPFLKFKSVSIDSVSGHVAVGSSTGCLALFNYKIGKYFSTSAHRKSIQFTQFSGDAKYVATYSINEAVVKIWQISHSGIFHMGNNPYSVKMVISQELPSIDDMIFAANRSPGFDSQDGRAKDRKSKIMKRSSSKSEATFYPKFTDSGLGLHWNSDNKTVAINWNELILREFKL